MAALRPLQRGQAITIGGFAVGAVIAIETGEGILGLAVAQAAALVAGGAAFVALLLRRAAPGLSLRGGASDYRRLTAFGSWTLLADSMAFAAERMDTIVIAALRGAAAAGPYAAAQKLRSGLQSLTLPLFALLLPMVSWSCRRAGGARRSPRARARDARRRAGLLARRSAALALFADHLVGAWLGSGAPASTADDRRCPDARRGARAERDARAPGADRRRARALRRRLRPAEGPRMSRCRSCWSPRRRRGRGPGML